MKFWILCLPLCIATLRNANLRKGQPRVKTAFEIEVLAKAGKLEETLFKHLKDYIRNDPPPFCVNLSSTDLNALHKALYDRQDSDFGQTGLITAVLTNDRDLLARCLLEENVHFVDIDILNRLVLASWNPEQMEICKLIMFNFHNIEIPPKRYTPFVPELSVIYACKTGRPEKIATCLTNRFLPLDAMEYCFGMALAQPSDLSMLSALFKAHQFNFMSLEELRGSSKQLGRYGYPCTARIMEVYVGFISLHLFWQWMLQDIIEEHQVITKHCF